MKTIYLHLGLHKTASSSFQETCKENKENLLKMGYEYPIFNSEHIKLDDICNHSIPFYSLFCEKPELYHVNIKNAKNIALLNDDYIKIIENHLSNNRNIILSGEDIPRLPFEKIEQIKSFFNEKGYVIKTFAVVRSPYEFHCSAIQQRVKMGTHVNFKKFISQIDEIEKVIKSFPDCRFIPFRELIEADMGPVISLLKEIGIKEEKCKEINIKRTNEGVSNLMVRLQNELNAIEPKIVDNKNNNHWKKVKVSFNDDKFVLTPMEFKSIKSKLDLESKFFKETLGESFLDKHFKTRNKVTLYNDLLKQTAESIFLSK